MNHDRRKFIQQATFAAFGGVLAKYASASAGNAPHILLRSGWQVENIGDIAHTPGLLHLLETYLPTATVTFWVFYNYLPPEEVAMIKRRFPNVNIIEGKLDEEGNASNETLDNALTQADFFLHGSGPATIAWADAVAFHKRTGKPYGIYGVTYGLYGIPEKEMLSNAAFVYFRDSVSLARAKEEGVHAPVMDFAPDAAFAFDIKNDEKANRFLMQHNLQPKKFICCIARLRNTPVWLHPLKHRPFDEQKNARNEAMAEHDIAPLRQAIIEIVQQTGMKILLVPEDFTQVELNKKEIYDKLPQAIIRNVVWRSAFWMPDEALSVYIVSAGLISHEMHSPILCIAHGIPALVCSWQEQSSKGIMWKDIGLTDWLFDFDNEDEVKMLAPKALAMAKNTKAFTAKAAEAQQFVRARQRNTMAEVVNACRIIS